MKTIIRKAYYNYEKEESWLNEMSAKGLALTDYSWCRYVFSEHQPTHPESQKYIRFMEENGVEYISSYMRWVYFRKKTSDGNFNIYSDIDSKIKHYRRINQLWTVTACVMIGLGIWNVLVGLDMLSRNIFPLNLYVGGFSGCFFVVFILLGHPLRRKIKKLKNEKIVIE